MSFARCHEISWVFLQRPLCTFCIFYRTKRSLWSPELASCKSFACHHSTSRYHLPHHYSCTLRHQFRHLHHLCPLSSGSLVHSGKKWLGFLILLFFWLKKITYFIYFRNVSSMRTHHTVFMRLLFFNSMFDRDKVLIGNRDKVFIGDTKVSIVYHHFIDNRDKIYLDSIKRKHKWRSCLH